MSALNSRGVKNNNPGNLKANQPWEGMTGADDAGFAVFLSPVWGFRAMFRNYIAYYDAGFNTIRKFVNHWSPAEGNKSPADPDGTRQVNAYIATLCQATGYGADDVIALKTWDVASKICFAQTLHECGVFSPVFTLAQMKEGAFRGSIVDAPAPIVKKVAAVVANAGAAGTAAVGAGQAAVATAQGAPHSPLVTIGLFVLAMALAGLGAWFSSRAKVAS